MSLDLITAMFGLIGIIIGAIPTYLFTRQKSLAEINKLKAETEKTQAEAEMIKRELQKNEVLGHNFETSLRKRETFDGNTKRLEALLTYIFKLHTTDYKLNYWRITYNIDSKGDTYTTEEMSIEPFEGKVHFRKVILGLSPSSKRALEIDSLMITNKEGNRRLETFTVSKTDSRLEFIVVLDPPATKGNPAEIKIESFRQGLFSSLIENLKDDGEMLIAGSQPPTAELRIIAPPHIEFTSFSISPIIGRSRIERIGKLSSIYWQGNNVPDETYAYVIQAKKRDT